MTISETSTENADSAETDSADSPVSDCADERIVEPDTDKPHGASRPSRRISFSVSTRGLLSAVLMVVLTGAAATFAWLYVDAHGKLAEQSRDRDNAAHAEKIALNYAVNAAAMNYQDLTAWKVKLVAGTSPELNDKLTKAASSMEQILVPLQWTSTAQPLTAKVHSFAGGVYVVDCFVSVQTKTVQAADALQSTATYSVTIDSNKDWQITDVGGIGAVVGRN